MFTGIEWINFSSLPVDGNDSSPLTAMLSFIHQLHHESAAALRTVQEMRMALPTEAMLVLNRRLNRELNRR